MVSKLLALISQCAKTLSASLVASGKTPEAEDCFSNLLELLSSDEIKQLIRKDRDQYFLNICRPALDLVAREGLLSQESLITAVTKYELNIAEPKTAEIEEVFLKAVAVVKLYQARNSPNPSLQMELMVKIGNLYTQLFQFNNMESDADRACNMLFQTFISNPTDIGAFESLSRSFLARAEIFGAFDMTIFQTASKRIQPMIGLDLTRTSESLGTLDRMSRGRCCQALLWLLRAQSKAFEVQLHMPDIDNVIDVLRKLFLIVEKDEQWLYKVHLSTSLRPRFRHAENQKDFNEALALAIEATRLAPGTPQARAMCLEAHAKALEVHYELFETERLLDEMVTLFSRALSARLEAPDLPSLLPMAILDLARALCFRYAKLGNINDKELAVSCGEKALACFPQNDLRRSLCMQTLGDIHLRLHWRSSGVEHLDEAMKYFEKCEQENDPDSVFSLYGSTQLNYALVQKGYRRDDTTMTKKAFKRKQDWLATHGIDDVHLSPIDKINFLLVPGQAKPFVARKSSTAEERDRLIEEAIESLEAAMEQKSKASRFVYVYEALGIALHDKAVYSQQLKDYERSIKHFRKSAEVFTEDQLTNHLRVQLNFSDVLYMAAQIGNTFPYAKEGLKVLEPIINDSRLSYWVRVKATVSAARFHFNLLGDAKAASLCLLKAHELIPRATSGMSRADQLQLLEEEFDIPAWTLVLELSQGTPETSLQLLERGRSIFWDGILNKKSVYTSGSVAFGPESGVYGTLRRLSVSSTSDQPSPIRPGDIFRDVDDLGISPEADGQEGPVVFINIHALQSDALILTKDKIHRLELPDLKEADCISYYHQFIQAQSILKDDQSKVVASNIMSDICKWLWESAAWKILDFLGIHDRLPQYVSSPRRIWWVTTKWTSVLPIHAAGDYTTCLETGEPNSVFDRVVSSYVPTIKILKFLRRRSSYFKSKTLGERATALLVAMPTTPGELNLRSAQQETEMVKKSVSSLLQVRELIHPTSKEVIAPLQDCTFAHFACHTKINDRDPSKSQLQLLDWRSNQALTVDRLLNLELLECRMVYLSSCDSARDWRARETSMHIATGFLMAGVPNIVGTMWKVHDEVSAEVATTFYPKLGLGEGMGDFSRAAVGLHETVRELKESGAELVDWAPYVHFGS